jgi:putative aldouronate transport system permease protein
MSNRLFYLFNGIFWALALFATIYPLYLVVIASFSSYDAIVRGDVIFWPVDFSLIGYEAVIKNTELWRCYGNSLFYVAGTIVVSLTLTMLAAYALSRKNMPGKSVINMYFVITMFFSGGLIPEYLLMRNIGLHDTRWLMIISGCVTTWNLMLARTYIQTSIPDELYEAAVLDGASHFQYFTKVVVPLSRTIMAVLAVYYGVSKWNNYFTGMVYIRDRKKLPLQTLLKEILATLQVELTDEVLLAMDDNIQSMMDAVRIANISKYCIIVVATAPVVILYVFLQKYFEKGVMIGSLKG